MSQNTYVSVNLTQDFTDEQKGTALNNIGADSYGTVDIDVLLTDETSVHLTVWFKADIANNLYRFYLVEEGK